MFTQDGSTPLLWAAQEGHSSIVSMFLADPDVEVNKALSVELCFRCCSAHGATAVSNTMLARSVTEWCNFAFLRGAKQLFKCC